LEGNTFSVAFDGEGTAGTAGSSQWSQLSDRRAKTAFALVDEREVVARLAEVPIETWQYLSQEDDIRHMGPMAGDLYTAFGLGEDRRYIGTLDADGVSMAAIQGLYAISQEQAAQVDALYVENAALRQQLDDFEARLAALEASAAPSPRPLLRSGLSPATSVLLAGLGLVLGGISRRFGPWARRLTGGGPAGGER
jgi:hypothetical protein